MLMQSILDSICNLTSSCFVCMKALPKRYIKMHSCGDTSCEFTFEENAVGSIFAELKNYREVCEFLLTTAILTFNNGAAQDMAEPFPGFLLI